MNCPFSLYGQNRIICHTMLSQKDSPDNPDSKEEYESMSFKKRLQRGLEIDRSFEHGTNSLFMGLFEGKTLSDLNRDISYRNIRHFYSWHVKREINKRLVDQEIASKHLIDQSRPILLDMMMSKQPTEKDWTQLSVIYNDEISSDEESKHKLQEKSVRRTMEYYPHIVTKLFPDPSKKFEIDYKDTEKYIDDLISKIPDDLKNEYLIKDFKDNFKKFAIPFQNLPEREDERKKDKRPTNITTSYSLLSSLGRLDATIFVDENYLIRFDRYWKKMLSVMSEIIQSHELIPKMEWFVYHIVNKDVGLHVLFDNVSSEYESRWLKNLSENTQMQIMGLPGMQSEPYWITPDHVKKGIKEILKQSKEFEHTPIPPILLKYKIPAKSMKKRATELVMAAVEGFDSTNNINIADFTLQELTNELKNQSQIS